jgi:hypothetical protein
VRGAVAAPIVSCQAELRKQVELRDQLEWYRLALAVLAACALLLLALLGATVCGCRCSPGCFARRRAPAGRSTVAAKKGDAHVLAFLAAQ